MSAGAVVPRSGDLVEVPSSSGNRYEGIYLSENLSGVFLKTNELRIVRLGRDRILRDHLRVLGPGQAFHRDDEILFTTPNSGEIRGRVDSVQGANLVLCTSAGPIGVSLDHFGEVHLVFRAKSLRHSDEFRLTSRSGRAYRGVVMDLNFRFLRATLAGQEETVSLRISELDLRSVEVLVPLALEACNTPSRERLS